MTRARDIANFGDGIATADIGDGQITAGKLNSTLDLTGKTVTLPAGVGGKVLQVVSSTLTDTQESTTSTSFVDTSLTASITPSSASNDILVLITSQGLGNAVNNYAGFGIKRNSTDLVDSLNFFGPNSWQNVSISYLDSPASAISVTYTLRIRSYDGNLAYHGWGSTPGSTQSIILMEIAG